MCFDTGIMPQAVESVCASSIMFTFMPCPCSRACAGMHASAVLTVDDVSVANSAWPHTILRDVVGDRVACRLARVALAQAAVVVLLAAHVQLVADVPREGARQHA